jgi:hypothetical protein
MSGASIVSPPTEHRQSRCPASISSEIPASITRLFAVPAAVKLENLG